MNANDFWYCENLSARSIVRSKSFDSWIQSNLNMSSWVDDTLVMSLVTGWWATSKVSLRHRPIMLYTTPSWFLTIVQTTSNSHRKFNTPLLTPCWVKDDRRRWPPWQRCQWIMIYVTGRMAAVPCHDEKNWWFIDHNLFHMYVNITYPEPCWRESQSLRSPPKKVHLKRLRSYLAL